MIYLKYIILFACLSLIFKACDFVFDAASDGCSEGCGCIIFVLLILAALTCI